MSSVPYALYEDLELRDVYQYLTESVFSFSKMLEKIIWGKTPGGPEDFYQAWINEKIEKGEIVTSQSLKKELLRIAEEIKKIGAIEAKAEIEANPSLDESLNEGMMMNIFKKGTYYILGVPMYYLAKALVKLFFWSLKNPLGKMGWIMMFLTVGVIPFASFIASAIGGGYTFAVILGLVYWMVLEFSSAMSKFQAGGFLELFSTRPSEHRPIDFIFFWRNMSSVKRMGGMRARTSGNFKVGHGSREMQGYNRFYGNRGSGSGVW